MKTYMLLAGVAVAAVVVSVGGCGEGPVFPEDRRVLAEEESAPVKGVEKEKEKPSADRYDPDVDRKIKDEEKKQEETQKKEEERQKAVENASEALDRIGSFINDQKFDEAKKTFDDYRAMIEQSADEGMQDSDPKIAELYREYWDLLKKMREILDREDLSPDEKRERALDAYSNAGMAKRSAGQMKIYER